MTFKYRYVAFGTRFVAGKGHRAADDGERDPGTLYANELSVDVGSSNWTGAPGEPAVIDHHAYRESQFPSAAAAVLHHAQLVREYFSAMATPVVWLVAHRDADFDALAAMYLARWLIEDRADVCDWERCGLDRDAWKDVLDSSDPSRAIRRIDWFRPDIVRFPAAVRWAILLASYASHVDHARRIWCPRDRALHSVLYAAFARGRDLRNADDGAVAFFDEARRAIESGLNPLYDPLFGPSSTYAPELALLARENDAYARDLARARKTIVFVPSMPGRFDDAYGAVAAEPLLDGAGAIAPAQRAFGNSRRTPTDGLYLRDPECILFKEWARLDLDNSSLHEGFTFTAIAYSDGRLGAKNESDYFISLDLENARGRHLYPVWARLEQAEIAALKTDANQPLRAALEANEQRAESEGRTECRVGFVERAGPDRALFADPWYDGGSYRCTIVATPAGGTLIAPAGVRPDLSDDPVAMLVRDELESSVYVTPFSVWDFPSAGPSRPAPAVRAIGVRELGLEPVARDAFRFVAVGVDDGADFGSTVFSHEAAAMLWQVLRPAEPGAVATGIASADATVLGADILAVWSPSGVALAYRPGAAEKVAELRAIFAEMAELSRGTGELLASENASDLERTVATGEGLMRGFARLQHRLTRADGTVLERFAAAVRLFETLDLVREINRVQATRLQTERLTSSTETVAEVQLKVEWLELLFVGIYATELANIIAENAVPPALRLLVIMIVSFGITAVAASFLKPWARDTPESRGGSFLLGSFVFVLTVGVILGILVFRQIIKT